MKRLAFRTVVMVIGVYLIGLAWHLSGPQPLPAVGGAAVIVLAAWGNW